MENNRRRLATRRWLHEEYTWPGNIRELENLVKRYVIVGNEAQIIRELSTHKPTLTPVRNRYYRRRTSQIKMPATARHGHDPDHDRKRSDADADAPSLLEIGRKAAMSAEREAIERVLTQTRWNRRQAAKILKISYKALLNKLKASKNRMRQNKNLTA